MSPEARNRGPKAVAVNNIYTALLAVACGVVLVTAALVAYKCQTQYKTLFNSPRPASHSSRFR
jgi:hypothetical protein